MQNDKRLNFNTNILPWETLKDIFKFHKIKSKDFARFIWVTPKYISNVLNWKERITYLLAFELEKIFGISAEFFLNLQSSYDLYDLRN